MERGWCLGGEQFRHELLEQVETRPGPSHFGEAGQDAETAQAERWVAEGLRRMGWRKADLKAHRKGEPRKVALARELRSRAAMQLAWMAERLRSVSSHVQCGARRCPEIRLANPRVKAQGRGEWCSNKRKVTMRLFARNKQSWLSIVCIPQSINAALLCACFWVSLGLLAVREADAQGAVTLNTRISGLVGTAQTIHIWGPSATDPGLSLIGLGSNDNPSGTTPFGSASGMSLIGAGGSGGHFGYATTYASLIGALGQNQPESSLTVLSPGGVTTFRTGSALGCVQPTPILSLMRKECILR